MEYILVTVRLNKDENCELKIPGSITAGELSNMFKEIFHLDRAKSLHVEPLGRILGEDEVLIDEGVYNGAQIILI